MVLRFLLLEVHSSDEIVHSWLYQLSRVTRKMPKTRRHTVERCRLRKSGSAQSRAHGSGCRHEGICSEDRARAQYRETHFCGRLPNGGIHICPLWLFTPRYFHSSQRRIPFLCMLGSFLAVHLIVALIPLQKQTRTLGMTAAASNINNNALPWHGEGFSLWRKMKDIRPRQYVCRRVHPSWPVSLEQGDVRTAGESPSLSH